MPLLGGASRRAPVAFLFSSLCISYLSANTSTTILGAQGLTVFVDPSGAYSVQTATPLWRFAGYIGQPLSNLSSSAGIDPLGSYSEISFDFQTDAPRHAAIRAYWDSMTVLFTVTAPSGAPNTFAFPNFTQTPALGLKHLAFSDDFGGPQFSALPSQSPWVFFDSSGNTFVFSAASQFMAAGSYWNSATGQIAGNIAGQIATLPAGFSHQTVLTINSGINAALVSWGRTLTTLQGKRLPPNDAGVILNKIGYWTDNGASYYYAMESPKSYP